MGPSYLITRTSPSFTFFLFDIESNAFSSESKTRALPIILVDPILVIFTTAPSGAGGFDVDAFTDPGLALSSYKPGLYDLILIDIKMPKIDGFVLYELLKTVDNGVKVCFLTASEMYSEEVREVEHCALNKVHNLEYNDYITTG